MSEGMTGRQIYQAWLQDLGGMHAVMSDYALRDVNAALLRYCNARDRVGEYDNESAGTLREQLRKTLVDYLGPTLEADPLASNEKQAAAALSQVLFGSLQRVLALDRQEMREAIVTLFAHSSVSANWMQNIAPLLLDGVKVGLRGLDLGGADGKPITGMKKLEQGAAQMDLTAASTGYLVDRTLDATLDVGAKSVAQALADSTRAGTAAQGPVSPLATIWAQVRKFVDQISDGITAFLGRLFSTYKAGVVNYVKGYFTDLQKLLTTTVEVIVRQVLPGLTMGYVSIVQLTDQLPQLLETAINPVLAYFRNRHTRFTTGAASDVIHGARLAQIFMGADGVFQVGQTVTTFVTATVATPNAGLIVKSLLAIGRNLARMCLRLWEYRLLSNLCNEAKTIAQSAFHGETRIAAASTAPGEDGFTAWFRPYARLVPSVAALVLSSGICGAKHVWLELGDLLSIDPAAFSQGGAYLESLAAQGRRYLAQSGLKISGSGGMELYLETGKVMGLPADVAQKAETSWRSSLVGALAAMAKLNRGPF